VEEGRALVPRYAPGWTDHNVHDPGITLIELFAWLIEADIYRANHISSSCRRKFLKLIGFSPRPPQAAQLVLSFTLKSGLPSQLLPAGMTFRTTVGPLQLAFRTLADLTIVDSAVVAVQTTSDGLNFMDQTRVEQGRFGFAAFDLHPPTVLPIDPERQPALYLGFSKALPVKTAVTWRLRFAGLRTDQTERRKVWDELRAVEASCIPLPTRPECSAIQLDDPWCPERGQKSKPRKKTTNESLRHQSIRTAWDYFDGTNWRTLDEEQSEVIDDTRGFTLDGPVTIALPTAMKKPPAFGAIRDEHGQPKQLFYLRCRLEKGRLDFLPIIMDIQFNSVLAEQATSAASTFEIRPGVKPPPGHVPVVGEYGHINLSLDGEGVITKLALASKGDGPYARVLAYTAAKPTVPGSLAVSLAILGWGTGLPGQSLLLPDAPIAGGLASLWTVSSGITEEWNLRPDLHASKRTDPHFILNPTTGEISFGDGERGRVVASDAIILARYDYTAARAGNIRANGSWHLKAVDDIFNQALLGAVDVDDVRQALAGIRNVGPANGGLDEEELDHAAGRAAEILWAHERLLELCPPGYPQTLDGLDPEYVFARVAPTRATTILDYERLALEVPGAPVARVRAWAGIDPDLPCVSAPGTVVVTVIPWLPAHKPEPSAELLNTVKAYLDRRRLVGTRLVTVGPKYLLVSVKVTIAVSAGASPVRVVADVTAALNRFLSPLSGGPSGRGWPFGRDVYRSEILEVIDQTPGVDHVEDLRLLGGTGEPQCGNLCVGPLMLVTPGVHEIKAVPLQRTNENAKY